MLFDLDGTLTNPKPGITRCIAYAVDCLGLPPVDPDTLGWCIGPPLRGTFGKVLGTTDPDLIASAIVYYRERFGDVGLFENEVYEGIPEVLNGLKAAGMRLFVATSKPETYANRIIERFELAPYFERVVGSELDGTREPKAEVIAHVISQCDADPAAAVMVGDRMHDVQGAHENGMPCIGVLYGFGEEGELHRAGAWSLCNTPYEIPAAIRSLALPMQVHPPRSPDTVPPQG
ncbi:MAG: HAD family hydrolase [Fimbriimonas sp.]